MAVTRALVGRREFLRRAAGAGLGVALAPLMVACSSREDVRRLSFLNWQDYIAPGTLNRFTSQTGVQVTYQTYASNDELEQRLIQAGRPRRGGRSGTTFDLIVPSDNFVLRFRRLELIQELDRDRLTNLGNVRSEFQQAVFDPGNRFTIPWATGTTGIGYDTRALTQPPTWEVFLDQRFAGRMTVLAEIRDAFAAALFSIGRDPNTRLQADIDAAADRLIAMKKVIRGFDSDTYLDDLASGELVIAHAYSSDLLQAKQRNPNLEFVLPAEGALRWVDSLAVPVGAPHKALAESFIDYYLRPDVSADVANFVQVDTGNSGAASLLDPTVRDNPIVFPPSDVLARLVFTEDLGDDEERYAKAWERVQAA